MLWELEFPQLFTRQLDRNTENMFSISLENTATKKENQLVYFDHQSVNSLCYRVIET